MVVIGAGAGGLVSAAGSAGVGAKVAIIEKDLMGGEAIQSYSALHATFTIGWMCHVAPMHHVNVQATA